MKARTPREIVAGLDRAIVGQENAKRALAVAIRNRWRRANAPEDMRPQIAKDDPRFAQTERIIDSAAHLAEHMHEAPVMVIPCIEGRYENAGVLGQASMYGSILPAAWSFMLALRPRGLATAWTTLHLMFEADVAAILGIPDTVTQTVLFPVAYYTGTVFELFDAKGELRAICGGGRYDNLLQSLGGVDLPALGFGMGDVVLGDLLRERGLAPPGEPTVEVFLAAIGQEDVAEVLGLARELRDGGLRVEYALAPQTVGKQLKLALLTIACMLGLAYLMNYSGMTSTLGLVMAGTGGGFPFFSAVVGWLGVFLTGSDTSANALFGNLQVVTANALGLNPILMASVNSAAGVMGKMISVQSIAVAVAATGMTAADESRLFRFTIKHSVLLMVVMGIISMLFAYVFAGAVPVVPAK